MLPNGVATLSWTLDESGAAQISFQFTNLTRRHNLHAIPAFRVNHIRHQWCHASSIVGSGRGIDRRGGAQVTGRGCAMAVPKRFASELGTRSTLPAAPTRLVGREREVVAARDRLLDPEVRSLTFTGPGGTGKTRLALAVAASLADAFADGVHFVDLPPIPAPTLGHGPIAPTLGI